MSQSKGERNTLKVAVPWALSHYIPLNGFHPLYRALFDHVPSHVELIAWDNVALYERLSSDSAVRDWLVADMKRQATLYKRTVRDPIAKKYEEYWGTPNRYLTAALIGDVEFHHTAPFPSLRRPFVLHCEMFAPLLFPFSHQGKDMPKTIGTLREHYRKILSNDLCLGIVSHIPDTLSAISRFFSDSRIDVKLMGSRIGLSAKAVSILEPSLASKAKPTLARPVFVFINSANQNPANFFRRGGHIVLRFWKRFLESGHDGLLIMRCSRPTDGELRDYAVDPSFVTAESGRRILWSQAYFHDYEMNALMERANFFLLPSLSLHSVSIMQAMSCGAVPVVTDTIGTSLYVQDNETGMVLKGVRDAMWHEDEATGVLVDRYRPSSTLDDALVSQLTDGIRCLLAKPDSYDRLRHGALNRAAEQFSGHEFSADFWRKVTARYELFKERSAALRRGAGRTAFALSDCTMKSHDWERVFESPTQPMPRIGLRSGMVFEFGGAFVCWNGDAVLGVNDWSVCAPFLDPATPRLRHARTLVGLNGAFLTPMAGGLGREQGERLIRAISRALKPYPSLHRAAAWIWLTIRRCLRHYSPHISATRENPTIELIREGVQGYNVILCDGVYYAILQREGEFVPDKARNGGYSSCFSDHSLDVVLQCIAAGTPQGGNVDSSNSVMERRRPVRS